MKYKLFVSFMVLAILILIAWGVLSVVTSRTPHQASTETDTDADVLSDDPRNASYTIEGNAFTLVMGEAIKNNVLNSAIVEKVSIIGEPVFGDIDGVAGLDAAVVLRYDAGGTGNLYYVAYALRTEDGYVTTNSLFIGDRIVIDGLTLNGSSARVAYKDRKLDQDFSMTPTIAKVFAVSFDAANRSISKTPDVVTQPVTNADKLLGAPWKWVKTAVAYKTYEPARPELFTLTFNADGTFTSLSDCNSIGGSYSATHSILQFTNIYTTLMACQATQSQEFNDKLGAVQTYRFDAPNYLVLEFYGGGIYLTR